MWKQVGQIFFMGQGYGANEGQTTEPKAFRSHPGFHKSQPCHPILPKTLNLIIWRTHGIPEEEESEPQCYTKITKYFFTIDIYVGRKISLTLTLLCGVLNTRQPYQIFTSRIVHIYGDGLILQCLPYSLRYFYDILNICDKATISRSIFLRSYKAEGFPQRNCTILTSTSKGDKNISIFSLDLDRKSILVQKKDSRIPWRLDCSCISNSSRQYRLENGEDFCELKENRESQNVTEGTRSYARRSKTHLCVCKEPFNMNRELYRQTCYTYMHSGADARFTLHTQRSMTIHAVHLIPKVYKSYARSILYISTSRSTW